MAAQFGNLPTGGGFNPSSFQPMGMRYTNPNSPPPEQDGGSWVWDFAKGAWDFIKGNAGDILQTGAGLIEGYMSSADRAKQLEELKRQFDANLTQRQAEAATASGQFDRTTGNTEAQLAVQAQAGLNRAPVADKAQALLLSRMGVAPSTFQPRDYTKGTGDLLRNTPPPSAHVTQTMQQAANNYRPGDGGVNTSTTQWLLNRMRGSADHRPVPTTPKVPTTPTEPTNRGDIIADRMRDQLERFRRSVG